MELKRGELVRHSQHDPESLGSTLNWRVSLHSLCVSKRLTRKTKVKELDVPTTIRWRARLLSTPVGGRSPPRKEVT